MEQRAQLINNTREENVMHENQVSTNQNAVQQAENRPPQPQLPQQRVTFNGVDVYKEIVANVRTQLNSLISSGHMTEDVANTILREFMYDAFKKAVTVTYQ